MKIWIFGSCCTCRQYWMLRSLERDVFDVGEWGGSAVRCGQHGHNAMRSVLLTSRHGLADTASLLLAYLDWDAAASSDISRRCACCALRLCLTSMAVVADIYIPERISNITVHSTRILGLWQLAGDKLHVRRQGDRRVLRRSGDVMSNVPCMHSGSARWAHGYQVPLSQRHCLWSGNKSVRESRRSRLYKVRKVLQFKSRIIW